jgi:hypothetical protein
MPCKLYFSTVIKEIYASQVWWCTPVILALGRLRQEDCKFEASLDYGMRLCLKKKKSRFKVSALKGTRN